MKNLVVGFFSLVCAVAVADDIRYAKPDGNDTTGDGLSWATAYASPQVAVDNCPAGGIVYLAEGVYSNKPPTVANSAFLSIEKDIKVYGAGRDKTILKPKDATLAYGIFLRYGTAEVHDLTVSGDYRNGALSRGLCLSLNSPNGGKVYDCRFTRCQTGAYLDRYNSKIYRCLIDANTNSTGTAGISLNQVGGEIYDCVICNNADLGTAATAHSAGIGMSGPGTAIVRNCTITGNYKASGAGAGLMVGGTISYSAKGNFENNIIAGNNAPNALAAEADVALQLEDTRQYFTNCLTSAALNDSCLQGQAIFVDAANGDFRTTPASPTIDAGWERPDAATATDFAGNARKQGAAVDIGAYEFDPMSEGCDFRADKTALLTGETVTLTAFVSPGGADDYTCSWEILSGDRQVATGSGTTFSRVLEESGALTVKLTATKTGDPSVVLARTRAGFLSAAPGNVYVVTGENPGAAAPYTSWATAATRVEDALAAVADGGTVHLSNGVHEVSRQIDLTRAVTIRGEFGRDVTTLRRVGTGHSRLVRMSHPEACVEGLTLTGADGDGVNDSWGACVFIDVLGGVLQDCRVTDNTMSAGNQYGIVGIRSPDGVMRRTTIDRNVFTATDSSGGVGGGFAISAGLVESCLVTLNTNRTAGGAWIEGGTVRNCTFTRNYNNTVVSLPGGNNRVSAGGVAFASADIVFENNIVAGNTAPDKRATYPTHDWIGWPEWSVAYLSGTPTGRASLPTLTNNIHNCLFGSADKIGLDLLPGEDPGFDEVNGGGVFYLRADSVCVDAGRDFADVAGETDLIGQARKLGERVDVGAVEFDPNRFVWSFSVDSEGGFQGVTVGFASEFRPGTAEDYDILWTIRDGERVVTTSTLPSFEYLFPDAGTYTVSYSIVSKADPSRAGSATYAKPIVIMPDLRHVYVTNGVNPYAEAPYTSWKTAASRIKDALDVVSVGGTVHLSSGTFDQSECLTLAQDVAIVGQGPDKTVIRRAGDGNSRLFILNHPNAALSNVTLTGANGDASVANSWGSCVLINTDGGRVEDCLITGNTMSAPNQYGMVALKSENAVVRRCRIVGNAFMASDNAGAIGGGLAMSAGLVESCLIAFNTNRTAGGAWLAGGTMRNCTITKNRNFCTINSSSNIRWSGGGVVFASKDVTFENNIVAGNTAYDFRPARTSAGDDPIGFPEWTAGPLRVSNVAVNMSTLSNNVSNCCFGEAEWIGGNPVVGDPVFKSPANGNFHLRGRSPCVNAGLYDPSWMTDATDLEGRPRVKKVTSDGGFVDLGCYESPLPPGLMILVK